LIYFNLNLSYTTYFYTLSLHDALPISPNFLHFPMAKKLLENGFHVICEKPLTTTFQEAKILQEIQQRSQTVFAVTYTYTGYPMRSEEHTSELQSRENLVCRLLLEKKNK